MRRFALVCLFVLTSVATWAPGAAARGTDDDLPKAPQSKGQGLEFSVSNAIIGESFEDPLNLEANSDGDVYLLMTLQVENTSASVRLLESDRFSVEDGDDLIQADPRIVEQANDLNIDVLGEDPNRIAADEVKDFLLGWRVSPELEEFILDIDFIGANTIDLKPWLDQDIDLTTLLPDVDRSITVGGSDDDDDAAPTRRPTTTPRPTATPDTSRITTTERAYLNELESQRLTLGLAIVEVGDLFDRASSNPALIRDQTWIFDLALQLATWQAVYADAQTLDPSPRQQTIQDTWLELTGLVAGAADDYAQFVDYLDTSAADAGVLKLGQATDLLPVLTGLIEDFESDPSSFTASDPARSNTDDQTVADCTPFASYDEAQDYYASNPDAQPIIDPDFDGQACEVYFGRG